VKRPTFTWAVGHAVTGGADAASAGRRSVTSTGAAPSAGIESAKVRRDRLVMTVSPSVEVAVSQTVGRLLLCLDTATKRPGPAGGSGGLPVKLMLFVTCTKSPLAAISERSKANCSIASP
jgi:hypothetical protein